MKSSDISLLKSITEKIAALFEANSGHMLLATSAIGYILSSFAQSLSVITNDKYTVSQKAFMIPQEIAECCVSIGALLITTLCIQKGANKYVRTGKLLTKDLKEYLVKNNLIDKRGKFDFDLKNHIDTTIKNIQEAYKNSSAEKRAEMLLEHNNALTNYSQVEDATSTYATLAGGVISTALLVPVIRNYIASHFQQTNIQIINKVRKRQHTYSQRLNNPAYIVNSTPLNNNLKI